MEIYDVQLTDAAEADYIALDGSQRKPVRKQLEKLCHFPDSGKPLKNVPGLADLSGHYKLYVSRKSLRIIFTIDREKKIVTVKGIGPRADLEVYKSISDK